MTPVFANLFEPENENPDTQSPDTQNPDNAAPKRGYVVTLNNQRYYIDCICNGGCYPPCYDAPDGKCNQDYDCPSNCYC